MSFQGHHSTYTKCKCIDINYFISWHILQHTSKNNQSTHADDNYTHFISNQISLCHFVLSQKLTVSGVLALMFYSHFHQYVLHFSLFLNFYNEIFILYTQTVCKLLSILLIYVSSTKIFKFQFQLKDLIF